MKVEVFCDGSIVGGNPGGAGGWAAVLVAGDATRVISGTIEPPTTNNRAELEAALNGLRAFKRPIEVTVYCDSKYVVDTFNENRIEKWAENNWMRKPRQDSPTRNGGPAWRGSEPIPNRDLWEKLNKQAIVHNITWVHVKGHTGAEDRLSQWNQVCHESALSAARLAWEVHQKGLGQVPDPGTVEGRTALSKQIQSLPDTSPPPEPEVQECWAVFRRQKNGGVKLEVLPMSPSEHPDGGRRMCMQAAHKMNKSLVQEKGHKEAEIDGKPVFEARQVSGVRSEAG